MASSRLHVTHAALVVVAALLCFFCQCAHAGGDDAVLLPLPGGTKPEGVCNGKTDEELFVSGLGGWVVHVNATTKVATKIVSAAPSQLAAFTGVKYDAAQDALFVTSGFGGNAYVMYLERGGGSSIPPRVARTVTVRLGEPMSAYVNDVVLTPDAAVFTDSTHGLVAMPRVLPSASKGAAPRVVRYSLGADFDSAVGLRANGIAALAPRTLLVTNYALGQIALVELPAAGDDDVVAGADGSSGNSSAIAARVTQVALPASVGKVFPDGLLLVEKSGSRTLWVADNFNNRLLGLQLSADGRAATLRCVIKSASFRTPTNLVARADGRLWAVNAAFLDCPFYKPCTDTRYEVVGVRPADYGC